MAGDLLVPKKASLSPASSRSVASHLDERLDEALEESFPASDPAAVHVSGPQSRDDPGPEEAATR